MGGRQVRHLLLCLLVGLVQACAPGAPDRQAVARGFHGEVVAGQGFDHQVYFRPGRGDRLHIYIEGDGRPWSSPTRISPDPTGRRLLMFELAAIDGAPVLYLGRPCYFGVADDRCEPRWWTFYRYSEAVVNSMAAVIGRYAPRYSRLYLFGHSGGGTLAVLLAARQPEVAEVVTIAANLDIDAWTERHDYTPLVGSLNPADQPPLPARIRQLHLLGGSDTNVTRDMIEPVVGQQQNAEFRVVPGADHRSGWRDYWPQVLRESDSGGGAAPPP